MLDLLDIFEIVKGMLFDAEPPFLDTSMSTRLTRITAVVQEGHLGLVCKA
jgi:hypothetical protein